MSGAGMTGSPLAYTESFSGVWRCDQLSDAPVAYATLALAVAAAPRCAESAIYWKGELVAYVADTRSEGAWVWHVNSSVAVKSLLSQSEAK